MPLALPALAAFVLVACGASRGVVGHARPSGPESPGARRSDSADATPLELPPTARSLRAYRRAAVGRSCRDRFLRAQWALDRWDLSVALSGELDVVDPDQRRLGRETRALLGRALATRTSNPQAIVARLRALLDAVPTTCPVERRWAPQ